MKDAKITYPSRYTNNFPYKWCRLFFPFTSVYLEFVHYILHHVLLARDDPESIEICYVDINCLAPEGYLTSTIMNFYIRFVYLDCCNNWKYTWIIPMAVVLPYLSVSYLVLHCSSFILQVVLLFFQQVLDGWMGTFTLFIFFYSDFHLMNLFFDICL